MSYVNAEEKLYSTIRLLQISTGTTVQDRLLDAYLNGGLSTLAANDFPMELQPDFNAISAEFLKTRPSGNEETTTAGFISSMSMGGASDVVSNILDLFEKVLDRNNQ